MSGTGPGGAVTGFIGPVGSTSDPAVPYPTAIPGGFTAQNEGFAGVIHSVEKFFGDLFDDPEMIEKGWVTKYRHPIVGEMDQFGLLFDFGETLVEQSLLEADVSYDVAKDFVGRISEQAMGEKVLLAPPSAADAAASGCIRPTGTR